MNMYVTQIVTLKISKTEKLEILALIFKSEFGLLPRHISEEKPEFRFLIAYRELIDTFTARVL